MTETGKFLKKIACARCGRRFRRGVRVAERVCDRCQQRLLPGFTAADLVDRDEH